VFFDSTRCAAYYSNIEAELGRYIHWRIQHRLALHFKLYLFRIGLQSTWKCGVEIACIFERIALTRV
jgi:hypothetical protein